MTVPNQEADKRTDARENEDKHRHENKEICNTEGGYRSFIGNRIYLITEVNLRSNSDSRPLTLRSPRGVLAVTLCKATRGLNLRNHGLCDDAIQCLLPQ